MVLFTLIARGLEASYLSQTAFSNIKPAQAKTTELSDILPGLAADTCDVGIEAFFKKKVSSSWKPISFSPKSPPHHV